MELTRLSIPRTLSKLLEGTLPGSGMNAAMQRANYPEMKHSQFSYSNSGTPINNVKMKGNQISWLPQPRPIAKEIASTFRSYVARHLHFVANDNKEPSLPHRLLLGLSPNVLLGVGYILKFVDFIVRSIFLNNLLIMPKIHAIEKE